MLLAKTIALVAATTVASSAFADTLKMTTSSLSNGSNGGSYTVTIINGPASNAAYASVATPFGGNSFESFCLEPTEYFTPGSTYNYTIASYAFGGANEASGRNSTIGDQLSLGATWLYSQYATGVFAISQASNLQFQRAIWYLEDDYTGYSTLAAALANPFLSLAAAQFGSLSGAQADAEDGAYGVWALNITSGSGNSIVQNQSQLYFAGNRVPDGGLTAALLGMGLLSMAWVKRRFLRA
jgi:hypothetical protein